MRNGTPEQLLLVGAVEIDKTPVGIHARSAIAPRFQPAQPQDTGQDAIRSIHRAPLSPGQNFTGKTSGDQDRTATQTGTDTRCDHVPACRRAMGSFAPPHPFARGGNPAGDPLPASRPCNQALLGHPHLQQNGPRWHAARPGIRPAGGVSLRIRFHGGFRPQ